MMLGKGILLNICLLYNAGFFSFYHSTQILREQLIQEQLRNFCGSYQQLSKAHSQHLCFEHFSHYLKVHFIRSKYKYWL